MKCPYCANGHDIAAYKELSDTEWEERIAAMKVSSVVFTGGEPTLYGGFYTLLNRLANSHHVTVYSNFHEPVVVPALPPQGRGLAFRASCHEQSPEAAAEWVGRVKAVHEAGYRVTCTAVLCPDNVLAVLKPHAIHVDEPQTKPPAMDGPVWCERPGRIIAPDGTRYRCVGKMVRKDPSGVVPFDAPAASTCHTPNECAVCDGLVAKRSATE
jgi:hypothetical protein